MVKEEESKENKSDEYKFRFRESFEDKGMNHDITAMTDTGAQQTVCGAERAKDMNITLHPNIKNISLSDAIGNPMPVIGVAHLYVIPGWWESSKIHRNGCYKFNGDGYPNITYGLEETRNIISQLS